MISDTYKPIKTLANGTTVNFSFNWAIISLANIRVFLEDKTTGVQTQVTTGFSIVFDDSTPGGVVTFDTAPTSDYYVILARNIPQTQEVDYKTASGFQGSVIQRSFDKLTAMVQDLMDSAKRSMQLPLGTDTTYVNARIPAPKKGRPIVGNDLEDGFTSSTIDLLSLENKVDAVEQAVADSETAKTQAETAKTQAVTAKNQAVAAKESAEAAASLLDVDTDPTLSANSDGKIASQKATKTYADNLLLSKVSSFILKAPNGVMEIDPSNASKFTVKGGLVCLAPDGLNADGTLKHAIITIPNDLSYTFTTTGGTYSYYVDDTGTLFVKEKGIFEQVEPPETDSFWYNTETNIMYEKVGGVWTKVVVAFLGRVSVSATGEIWADWKFTENKAEHILTDRTPHIVSIPYLSKGNSPGSGGLFYRTYSDGWIEMGGQVNASNGGTYTFPVPFIRLFSIHFNYITTFTGGFSSNDVNPRSYTNTGFTYTANDNVPKFFWRACGYYK